MLHRRTVNTLRHEHTHTQQLVSITLPLSALLWFFSIHRGNPAPHPLWYHVFLFKYMSEVQLAKLSKAKHYKENTGTTILYGMCACACKLNKNSYACFTKKNKKVNIDKWTANIYFNQSILNKKHTHIVSKVCVYSIWLMTETFSWSHPIKRWGVWERVSIKSACIIERYYPDR